MKRFTHVAGVSLAGLLLLSCAGGGSNNQAGKGKDPLADCPIAGSIVQIGDDQVVAVDQKLLKDTVTIPLSFLAEELEIIRLDDREEALTPVTGVTASDNYLLIWGEQQVPFKLFDKKGKFITNIGSYGQGPNEYLNVYATQLDEANNRIYILPWQSDRLLVFDLQGKAYDPIPLCLRTTKASFRVDQASETVAVVVLPFPGMPAVAWTQDFKGNRKSFIEPGHFSVPWDFSNEITFDWNSRDLFSVNITSFGPTRPDSLYNYDYANNRMRPLFTMNFAEDPSPWHIYYNLPRHYFGDTSVSEQISDDASRGGQRKYYIIDKKTAQGAYCHFVNDALGGIEIRPVKLHDGFYNGYYVRNCDPGELMMQLEENISRASDPAMKQKLTNLLATMDENDNNYILLAKLKK